MIEHSEDSDRMKDVLVVQFSKITKVTDETDMPLRWRRRVLLPCQKVCDAPGKLLAESTWVLLRNLRTMSVTWAVPFDDAVRVMSWLFTIVASTKK